MVTPDTTVRIASRGSQLALWQAETIQKRLLDANPGLVVEIEIIKTTGDKILDVPLAKIGDNFVLRAHREEMKGYGDMPDWFFWNVGLE